jgi:glycosyltransferase involved in cell wall biosynthesis
LIVTTVNTADFQGGAGKAAHRLNLALRGEGVNAFMVSLHKQSVSTSSIRAAERRTESSASLENLKAFWRETAEPALVKNNRTTFSSTIFSVDPFGLDLTEIPVVAASRVVHLHWTNGFLSPRSIRTLKDTGAPIVWTLHDQWAFTAGCHYTSGCENFVEGCRICPQISHDDSGFIEAVYREKLMSFRDMEMTVVTPSVWMADCAKRSAIFRNADVRVVRNPFDFSVFKPVDQEQRRALRQAVGLNHDDVAVLFGAQQVGDKRKGYGLLIEALRRLQETEGRSFKLFAFGRTNHESQMHGLPIYELGEVHDEARLAGHYSMADMFVLPSLEDNYPNTMIESLACGTPVVGYNIGGVADAVKDGVNGYVVRDIGSAQGLADAMVQCRDRFFRNAEGRDACRASVEAEHTPKTIAGQMLDIYREKCPGFDVPLTERELALVKLAEERNRTHVAATAKMDWESDIFAEPKLARAMMPLFRGHADEKKRAADLRDEVDLGLDMGMFIVTGREGGGSKYLGGGWAAAEMRGCWADQRNATLHTFLRKAPEKIELQLRLNAEKGGDQQVIVAFNDKRIGVLQVKGDTPTTFVMAADGPAYDGFVNIRLSFPKSTLVKRAGAMTWRSVRISGLKMRALPVAAAAAPAAKPAPSKPAPAKPPAAKPVPAKTAAKK